MFSRPPGKFPLTSTFYIVHLYLNTAEHSFLLAKRCHVLRLGVYVIDISVW